MSLPVVFKSKHIMKTCSIKKTNSEKHPSDRTHKGVNCSRKNDELDKYQTPTPFSWCIQR